MVRDGSSYLLGYALYIVLAVTHPTNLQNPMRIQSKSHLQPLLLSSENYQKTHYIAL